MRPACRRPPRGAAAIARARLTINLDAIAANWRALDALSDGRTTLTIAYRLSTIRDVDQIAVQDHGRIVETGTHTELIERVGRYAQLAPTDELIDRNQVPIAA